MQNKTPMKIFLRILRRKEIQSFRPWKMKDPLFRDKIETSVWIFKKCGTEISILA